MREVASRIERALPLLGASVNEIKSLKNFIKSHSNYEIENVKIIIQKYAPLELLTAGWGLIKAENATGKKDEKWIKIENTKISRICKEISYLIYKKE